MIPPMNVIVGLILFYSIIIGDGKKLDIIL